MEAVGDEGLARLLATVAKVMTNELKKSRSMCFWATRWADAERSCFPAK